MHHPSVSPIYHEILRQGWSANLNGLDISGMSSFLELFQGSEFDGALDRWNVDHVVDFRSMFEDSMFSGDISRWCIRADAAWGSMLAAKSLLMFPRIAVDEPFDTVAALLQMYSATDTKWGAHSSFKDIVNGLSSLLYSPKEVSPYRYQQAVFCLCSPYLRMLGTDPELHHSVLEQYDILKMMLDTTGSVHLAATSFADARVRPGVCLPSLD